MFRRLLASSALAVLTPAPCFADEFCDAVASIVASAETNFEPIRGAESSRHRNSFEEPLVTIPGAQIPYPGSPPCRSYETLTTVGYVFFYTCSFPRSYSTPEDVIARALADQIGACLGVDMSAALVADPATSHRYQYQLEHARVELVPHDHPHGGWPVVTVEFSPPSW